MPQASLNIKLLPSLRARLDACASAEGVSPPEFARQAVRAACEATERREGQRARMKAAAGRQADAGE